MSEHFHGSRTLPVAIAVATVLGATASPSPGIVLFAGALLAFGLVLLWPVNDAPLLILPFGLQWIPVAIKPIETALSGRPLDDLAAFGGGLTAAAVFSLVSLTALVLGLRLGAGPPRGDWSDALARDAAHWRRSDVLKLSLTLILAGQILRPLAQHAGPAMQLVLAFSEIRQAGLFMLAYWSLLTGEALVVLAAVVAVEIVFGMTTFFADFRETLLVLTIAGAAARPRLGIASFVMASVAIGLVVVVGAFWSEIKPNYRDFLNQGTGRQIVEQPFSQRVEYISHSVETFNHDQFVDGLARMVDRTSYIDFLAKTIQNVPAYIPHQDGGQLSATFIHIVTPRILFPDKPPTPDDTYVTAHYTGLSLQAFSNTSISIGYLGELYIDFGYAGGVIGAFIWGVFAGATFRIIRSWRRTPLLINYALAVMALLPFSIFETALIKLVGSVVTILIVTLVLQRVAAPVALPRRSREMRAVAQ